VVFNSTLEANFGDTEVQLRLNKLIKSEKSILDIVNTTKYLSVVSNVAKPVGDGKEDRFMLAFKLDRVI